MARQSPSAPQGRRCNGATGSGRCRHHRGQIMTRLLVRFLLLAAAAAGFAWIADRPGTIVIRWLNREIETSVLAGLAGIFLAVLALWFLLGLLRRLIGTPGAIGGYFRFRKARRGYESLSRGIIAAGAGDGASAQRFAAIAAKSLTDE